MNDEHERYCECGCGNSYPPQEMVRIPHQNELIPFEYLFVEHYRELWGNGPVYGNLALPISRSETQEEVYQWEESFHQEMPITILLKPPTTKHKSRVSSGEGLGGGALSMVLTFDFQK